jgi:hypothetical protein
MIKIIVQPTPKNIELLEYIDANITKINNFGCQVKIEIATTARIEMLNNNNIKTLPVMISPDKKLIVGVNDIIKLINKNISAPQQNQQPRTMREPRQKSIEDYMNDELYAGVEIKGKGKNRKMVVPQDKEGGSEEDFEFGKAEREYNKNHKTMKHRNPNPEESSEEEAPIRRQKPRRKQQIIEEYEEEDNIPQDDLMRYASMGGGGEDDKMMEALLANMPV